MINNKELDWKKPMNESERLKFKEIMNQQSEQIKIDILTQSDAFINQLDYYEGICGIRFKQALENFIRRETADKKFRLKK